MKKLIVVLLLGLSIHGKCQKMDEDRLTMEQHLKEYGLTPVKPNSFFKRLRKVEMPWEPVRTNKLYFRQVIRAVDSSMNAFRPITNIAAYGEPGNILMAGGGVSYQHLIWDAHGQKWNCQWSIAAMGWAGGSVAPKTPADIVSYGIMGGFFNNLLMVGPAFNGKKLMAVVAIGINLNN